MIGAIASVLLVVGVVAIDATAAAAAPTAWTVQSVPTPPGSTVFVNGLSCVGPTFCMAVGGTETGPLAERWDGRKWSIVPSPRPAGSTSAAFGDGVSCASATFCLAIGKQDTATGSSNLTERWDGRRWSIVPNPDPSIDFGSGDFLSCAGPRFCVAAEGFGSTDGELAIWNGSRWSVTATDRAPSPDVKSYLFNVSCASARFCLATGNTEVGTEIHTNYSVWNGTHWSRTPDTAADVATVPGSENYFSGGDVSCVRQSCIVSGNAYAGPAAIAIGLIESYSAQSRRHWVPTADQTLDGAANSLSAISCTSRTDCVASAVSTPSGGLERWNGRHWTPVPNTSGFVWKLSCAGSSFCAAVIGPNAENPQWSFLMGASPPPSVRACRRGGWRDYTNGRGVPFDNQTRCERYFAHH